ncbi:BlaI/MecI/CopY family transcriptional regulator [Paraglaciecola chathamensis]|uniref:Transcriptional repressor, CopY family n=1 Tax=Paraglaciecola chathamensis S18K6 TaxID=1127672 RepID=A0AAV3UT75_9ALTE|nr:MULTISPECIES: BlaI/MecI/CopY family transcriptional regulator [Paraglaciecola]MBN26428.1 TrmB family transcriptional regulator [Alteromonadaceae bacterium]GAC08329.1 transcriptional repressor, CopY family [Paraglaciecola chathamensis S18K6]|tara:strand:+ start:40591 stop:40980 length:390 start_codon:yes stop_codon:yes gene_type:complete
MVLGDLEKQVLNYLWQRSPSDVKTVHEALTREKGGSLNTIQTTLDRLFKKKLLDRHKRGHAFFYTPRVERENLIVTLIDNATRDFTSSNENVFVNAFQSYSGQLEEQELDALDAMIQAQREKLRQDKEN